MRRRSFRRYTSAWLLATCLAFAQVGAAEARWLEPDHRDQAAAADDPARPIVEELWEALRSVWLRVSVHIDPSG